MGGERTEAGGGRMKEGEWVIADTNDCEGETRNWSILQKCPMWQKFRLSKKLPARRLTPISSKNLLLSIKKKSIFLKKTSQKFDSNLLTVKEILPTRWHPLWNPKQISPSFFFFFIPTSLNTSFVVSKHPLEVTLCFWIKTEAIWKLACAAASTAAERRGRWKQVSNRKIKRRSPRCTGSLALNVIFAAHTIMTA